MALTHPGRGPSADPTYAERPRSVPLVGLIWCLLIINTLGPSGSYAILPISGTSAQLVTTASLGAAFTLALVLNPRLRIRPNAFLLLLTLLLMVSIFSSTYLQFAPGEFQFAPGALARCIRLALFIATLWLLTYWWQDSTMLVRHHVRASCALLGTVVIGLAIAPDMAMVDGRLTGVLWYLPSTDVAQYAAIVTGLTLVLWASGRMSGWATFGIAGSAFILFVMAHTRTATVALLAGLAMAGLSLTLVDARARRIVTSAIVTIGLIALAFSSTLMSWFRRGQSEEQLEGLTGRKEFWDALLEAPRTNFVHLFGLGLNHKGFDGLPIDSSWLTVYNEQGIVGVVIVAAFCLALLVALAMRPPSANQACAAFLIVYCLVASYTEVGLGDASPYLLHLFVAAALLAGDGKARHTSQIAAPEEGISTNVSYRRNSLG